MSEAFDSSQINWIRQGPANRRCYEIAERASLPKIVQELIDVLTSDCMGLTLSNMTALRLHESMPKTKCDDDSEEEDDSFSEDEDENVENEDQIKAKKR